MNRVLILRAQPAAETTARRAEAIGFDPIVAPLFSAHAVPWDLPSPSDFDAVVMTSAHAARLGGPGLAALRQLPCFAVGEATAGAALSAGFGEVHVGPSDGAALRNLLLERGAARVLHLCGRDFKPIGDASIEVVPLMVYAVEAVDSLPGPAGEALRGGALALLHSPRSAAHFALLVDRAGIDRGQVRIAAISPAAAEAAGGGWASSHASGRPRDEALLELAAKLCNIAPRGGTGKHG